MNVKGSQLTLSVWKPLNYAFIYSQPHPVPAYVICSLNNHSCCASHDTAREEERLNLGYPAMLPCRIRCDDMGGRDIERA